MFTFVGALICGFALISIAMFMSSRLSVLYKVIGGIGLTALALYAWIDLQAVLGFPLHTSPPDGSAIAVAVINAPTKVIYLWIDVGAELRAYEVPYSDDLAKAIMLAEQKHGRMIWRVGKVGQGGNPRNGYTDIQSDGSSIEVVPSLPPKDAA